MDRSNLQLVELMGAVSIVVRCPWDFCVGRLKVLDSVMAYLRGVR